MSWLSDVFSNLFEYIETIWEFIKFLPGFFFTLITYILEAILYIIFGVLFIVFKLALAFALWVMSICCGVEALGDIGKWVLNAKIGWSLFPPQVGYLIGQLQLDVCLQMVACAYLIRFLLNFIPSWLTRS